MKKLFTTIAFVLTGMMLFSQYYYNGPGITPNGNPGNLNNDYEKPYGNGLDPGWTNIQPASAPGWTAVQTIPFSFQFNASAVTQYKVSTSGVLTFTTSATTVPGNHTIIPSAAVPDKSVCIWGLDYSGGNCNDRIVTKTFGTAPNRQHWISFNSYNFQGGGSECWTYWSIVLEETTNKIYIVDQMNSWKNSCEPGLTLGIQINSTTAEMVTGSPNHPANAGANKTPIDNKYYEFIQGVRPQYDMGITYIQTNAFQTNNVDVEVRGILQNFGLANVTSYDINYSLNNGPTITESVSGVNMPQLSDDWYIHDSIWHPTQTGIYELKVWASNINGNADQNTSNDTMYKTIEVMGVFVPRKIMHEVFTSSASVLSKNGNDTLKDVLDQKPGTYSLIKYQLDGDPYQTAEGVTRKNYYQIDSLPDMYINGKFHVDPQYYDTTLYRDYVLPAYISITPTISRNGNTITVTAAILPFPEWTNPGTNTMKARIALVEKVTHNNATTNGETTFYNVFKKMLPDANGQTVGPFTPGIYVNLNRSYTFPASNNVENMNNIMAIVFIQDEVTGEVYQTANAEQPSGVIGITNSAEGIKSIYPNPAQNKLNVNYQVVNTSKVVLEITDITGKQIMLKDLGEKSLGDYTEPISVIGLSKGIYMLNLHIDDNQTKTKFIID